MCGGGILSSARRFLYMELMELMTVTGGGKSAYI